MAERDGINTPVVAVVGFLGAIITFGLIVLLIVIYYHAEARQQLVKDVDVPPAEIRRLVSQQEAQLADYKWLDREKQIVAIPIKLAMQQIVEKAAVNGDCPDFRADARENGTVPLGGDEKEDHHGPKP